jgi:hypothetical protein
MAAATTSIAARLAFARQCRCNRQAEISEGLAPMDISKIPVGSNPPWDVNVIIEVPLGGEPVKYEVDKVSGAMFVDRFLHTSMRYPCNYGFIPHTLAAERSCPAA